MSFESILMDMMKETHKKEALRRKQVIDNRCTKCKQCLLEKYVKMSEYDETLIDIIPQKGQIWSREYQCKEILKIMDGEM